MSKARKGQGLVIFDRLGTRFAVPFIRERLAAFDNARLESITLRPLASSRHWSGLCHYPSKAYLRGKLVARGYRISVAVGATPQHYPYTWAEPIAAQWTPGRAVSYSTVDITLANLDEAAVLVAGHEAWHYLTHARQIRASNTESLANAYGWQWLLEYRAWTKKK